MLVFKFGGASIKDANSIKNILGIIENYKKNNLLIIISAMGKTTNNLEKLLENYFYKKNYKEKFNEIKKFHFDIIEQLEVNNKNIFLEINEIFLLLEENLKILPTKNYDFEYDKIVSFGEILSTKIISIYLNFRNLKNKWIDVREILKTDNSYRNAKINWCLSKKLIKKKVIFEKKFFFITQGFISSSVDNFTTTLGREGSDFTASIFASILKSEKVVLWKDVKGILNADPNYFENTKKIDFLSYKEVIEMAFFGAKIIHPKTIKPLENKKIPLFVKCFFAPDEKGSVIKDLKTSKINVPIFILKKNQILISISPKDFSFMDEKNISKIFLIFFNMKIKINLIQNSAISFSVCIDDPKEKLQKLLEILQKKFFLFFNKNLELLTIINYMEIEIKKTILNKKIFLEQKSRRTVRFIIK
ncbi:MAG: hypothetical protein B6I24_09135 [Bacteroidetes bacterium 4572_128]|nr:MAG: hypothetical protein B6I24_09135 [Bacteroidetes bacterium 4572_128]